MEVLLFGGVGIQNGASIGNRPSSRKVDDGPINVALLK